MAGGKQAALRQRRDDWRESAPSYFPVDQRPANQNHWSMQPEMRSGFFGSGPFWAGFFVSALCIGFGAALNLSSSMQAATEIAPQLGMISVLLQPLMLIAMIWAVAFSVHRARVQDEAVTRLMRAADRLYQPADRAIDEIYSLQDAVATSLDAIDGKIHEVISRGDHLSQRLYEVFKDINQLSEANHEDVKAIIEQAEERRHFLQHANLMITSEANYELERNSSNVKHVLQTLKTEIDSFMARLSKDTASMRELVDLSASETEVVKIITDDLRTIVNSSYRVIQTAAEEGRAIMETALSEVQQASEERIRNTGDAVVRQMRENAEGIVAQLNAVAKSLQGSLETSSAAMLAAIQERTHASANAIETTAKRANDAALQKLTDSIAGLHARITGVVVEASSTIDGKLSSVLQELDNQRVNAINQITQKIVTMPDSMRSAADEAIQLIDGATEKTISAFLSATHMAGDQARDTMTSVDKRVQLVQKVLLEIQSRIEEMDSELRRGIAETSEDMRRGFMETTDGIREGFIATSEDLQKGFAETAEGVNKGNEETRKAIAGIKADYMARLSQTIAELSALTVAQPAVDASSTNIKNEKAGQS